MALVWILSGLVWTLITVSILRNYTRNLICGKIIQAQFVFKSESFRLLKSLPQILNLGQLMEGYFVSTKGWAYSTAPKNMIVLFGYTLIFSLLESCSCTSDNFHLTLVLKSNTHVLVHQFPRIFAYLSERNVQNRPRASKLQIFC